MSPTNRAGALLVLVVGLVVSGVTTVHAAQSTTLTSPFDGAYSEHGCNVGLNPTAICAATSSASRDGSLNGNTDISGIFLPGNGGLAASHSVVRANYPLVNDAFALIITATVHVASAATTSSGGTPIASPSGWAGLELIAWHATCQCAEGGYDVLDVVGFGLNDVSDHDYVLQARLQNYQSSSSLVPTGVVNVQIFANAVADGGLGQGSASTQIDATLMSVKVDVVSL